VCLYSFLTSITKAVSLFFIKALDCGETVFFLAGKEQGTGQKEKSVLLRIAYNKKECRYAQKFIL
jgi:hypothetical protein